MAATHLRYCADLAALIHSLGGLPPSARLQPEEQYLAFLSLKFLLPKLLDAKTQTIHRYESTLAALEAAPPFVRDVLQNHLSQHRSELTALQKAAEHVAKA